VKMRRKKELLKFGARDAGPPKIAEKRVRLLLFKKGLRPVLTSDKIIMEVKDP